MYVHMYRQWHLFYTNVSFILTVMLVFLTFMFLLGLQFFVNGGMTSPQITKISFIQILWC